MYASRPSFWNCSRLSFVIASSAMPSTSSRVSAIVKRTMYCTASGRSLVPSDMGPTSLVADERDVLALEHGLRLIRRHARLLEDSTGSVRSLARVPGVRAGEEETRLATFDDHRRVPIQRGLGHLDPLHGADDRAASTPLLNAQLGRAVVAGPDDGLARRDHGAASKQTRHVGRAAGSVRGSKNWPHVSSRRMPHSVSSACSLSAQCVRADVTVGTMTTIMRAHLRRGCVRR